MVVVGLLTGYGVMGYGTGMTVPFVRRRWKLWTTFLIDCVYSRETWFRILSYIGMPRLTPQVEITFAKWWIQAWKTVAKIRRKGFDSLIWLVAWSIWKERRRVHERSALQPVALASVILEQARLWEPAGFVSLASVLRPKLR